LARHFLAGLPFQLAQDDRNPVLLGQAYQLSVEKAP
jgi:hypothetical protein